jgi:hypothetical protein
MKIYYNKSILSIVLLSILLIGFSCKDQLDINESPNVPTLEQGSAQLVFPAAVLATVGKVGGDLTILGGIWAQNYTQSALSNQYKYIDAYDVKSTDFNDAYNVLFTNGLKNYKYVIEKAEASGDWTFYLMGTVMNAYTTAILVDLYDKIPYTEALQGTGNLQPKFDDGFAIYTDLLAKIDIALGKDFTVSTNSVIGKPGFVASDMVFGGNIDSWIAFANTLKLKLYLRMINAQPALAETKIKELINSGVSFLTEDAAVTNFTDVLGKDNPFYEQNNRSLNTPDNIRASKTFASWLIGNEDPRAISYFGNPAPAAVNQGDYNGTDPTYQSAKVFVQTATDPVIFISKAESYFLQAEADARYFGGANAQALYNEGVLAAFDATGNDGSSFIADTTSAYAFPNAGTLEQKIEAIIVQKWASFPVGCHAIEGFFEKNRTGYPVTSPVYSTDASYVAGQFVVAKNSVLPAGQLPKRLVYPYDETSRNSNAPALVPSTTPVWWGK